MDYYNNEEKKSATKIAKPKNWKNIWVFIIILLLLVAGIVTLYLFNIKTDENNLNAPTIVVNNNDGLPNEIYAYNGKVIELNDNNIKIVANKNENYLLGDKELIVDVDTNTKYRKFIVPAEIPELAAGETGSYYKRVDIDFNQIKLNDQVTVIAGENIKNKTEFTAMVVEVHNK